MICISLGNKGMDAIMASLRLCEEFEEEVRLRYGVALAVEIRIDMSELEDEEVQTVFQSTHLPLVATCRTTSRYDEQAKRRLLIKAMDAGASFIDMDMDAAQHIFAEVQRYARRKGVKVIASYHNFRETPTREELMAAVKRAVKMKADIAKVVAKEETVADCERVLSLYEENEFLEKAKIKLIAFSIGRLGSYTRMEAHRHGAPLMYLSLDETSRTAEGQLHFSQFKTLTPSKHVAGSVQIPTSKSVMQRAILSAAMARGKSVFENFCACDDVNAALGIAKQFGATVEVEGSRLQITGIRFPKDVQLLSPHLSCQGIPGMTPGAIIAPQTLNLFVGESGLLSRISIPIAAQIGQGVTITGEGSLLRREMYGCKEALETFGAKCLLSNTETLPALVSGPLSGGNYTLSGRKGSQLISGLLMALPLSKKDSTLIVEEATSVPYILLTLYTIRKFGINISFKRVEDRLIFKIPGKQQYKPCAMSLEGDWSSASNFFVAAAIFGDILIKGLDTKSYQADRVILEILKTCGARISKSRFGVRVRYGRLRAFEYDATHSPDLFPILTVLAAFCEGRSVLYGVNRLINKESNRADAIYHEFRKMGMEISIDGDRMEIQGMSLVRRIMSGNLLVGGSFSTRSDHRIAMALQVAALGCSGLVELDDTKCIAKSFPRFEELFTPLIGFLGK